MAGGEIGTGIERGTKRVRVKFVSEWLRRRVATAIVWFVIL